jgi:hypothetical protein
VKLVLVHRTWHVVMSSAKSGTNYDRRSWDLLGWRKSSFASSTRLFAAFVFATFDAFICHWISCLLLLINGDFGIKALRKLLNMHVRLDDPLKVILIEP